MAFHVITAGLDIKAIVVDPSVDRELCEYRLREDAAGFLDGLPEWRRRCELLASDRALQSFTAPINVFMLAFSGVPRTPYIDRDRFADLKVLEENWQEIRKEGENLLATEIKAAQNHDDAGFNSFFKKGWKRFYIKWYGDAHPSARVLCP